MKGDTTVLSYFLFTYKTVKSHDFNLIFVLLFFLFISHCVKWWQFSCSLCTFAPVKYYVSCIFRHRDLKPLWFCLHTPKHLAVVLLLIYVMIVFILSIYLNSIDLLLLWQYKKIELNLNDVPYGKMYIYFIFSRNDFTNSIRTDGLIKICALKK